MGARTFSLLAVDGGGTKCRAVVADVRGGWLGEGRAGSSNYQSVGQDAAAREVSLAVKAALTDAGYAPERDGSGGVKLGCAVFALAGLDTEQDRTVLTALVVEVLHGLDIQVDRLIIENDGFAALLGATDGAPGVLVIAGTGSIVYGVNKEGMNCRAGGWGHLVGDEGSGYWIGKKAITAVMKAEDGRGRPTRLTERLLSHLGLNNAEELYNWTFSPEYSVERVAQLWEVVSQALNDGDEASRLLVEEAADELYQGASAVIRNLSMENEKFSVILQGGVLQNAPYLRGLICGRIRSDFPSAQWDSAKKEPVYGVISMGLAHIRQIGLHES
ncbi:MULTISPECIES: N-acetylglucosamine kinase [unclassified Paenibacillus]|uniref:N-acetylglucosamine kinase n=1 Tax=unclassified Paenibacillus TaxID=185978 RepID=UPI001915355B|nr:BadF/BadG/BcrA/BcrD ATPase family protein [Paenibacillus sp. EPM92]